MRWRTTGMRVVGIIGLLVGCTSGSGLGVYDKPGAPEADVKRGPGHLLARIGQRERPVSVQRTHG